MSDATFTFKNYRCFEDSSPAVLRIGDGFTALVGQNNSGKSSLLKFFYELKDLVNRIGPNGNVINMFRGEPEGISLRGLYDSLDIFSDANDRGISIQVDFESHDPLALTRAIFYSDRNNPSNWRSEFFEGPERSRIAPRSLSINSFVDSNAFNGENPPRLVLNLFDLFDRMQSLSRSIYVGPFRNAINEGAAQYYDIQVGNSFVALWDNWKSGNSKVQNRAITRVTEDIQHIFDLKKLGNR